MSDKSEHEFDRLEALNQGLAESALELSPGALHEICRDEGVAPSAVVARMHTLLETADRKMKKDRLAWARRQYEARVKHLDAGEFRLPGDRSERRRLLGSVLSRRPELNQGLTLRYRDFTEISDDEVDEYLKQFMELGILTDGNDD